MYIKNMLANSTCVRTTPMCKKDTAPGCVLTGTYLIYLFFV